MIDIIEDVLDVLDGLVEVLVVQGVLVLTALAQGGGVCDELVRVLESGGVGLWVSGDGVGRGVVGEDVLGGFGVLGLVECLGLSFAHGIRP